VEVCRLTDVINMLVERIDTHSMLSYLFTVSTSSLHLRHVRCVFSCMIAACCFFPMQYDRLAQKQLGFLYKVVAGPVLEYISPVCHS